MVLPHSLQLVTKLAQQAENQTKMFQIAPVKKFNIFKWLIFLFGTDGAYTWPVSLPLAFLKGESDVHEFSLSGQPQNPAGSHGMRPLTAYSDSQGAG